MKFFLQTAFVISCSFLSCHPSQTFSKPMELSWDVVSLPLPPEIKNSDRQFSSLSISNDQLFMLPECRLQDGHEAVIFSVPLSNLDQLIDSQAVGFKYKKYPLVNIQFLADKMKAEGSEFEGMEALIVQGTDVYISVETVTNTPDCFLLKGEIKGDEVIMDTSICTAIRKPLDEYGNHIYNAGFESMLIDGNRIYCMYEYNYFKNGCYAYSYDLDLNPASKDSIPFPRLPYRLTDITQLENHHATGINFFYNGEGKDTIYRPQVTDSIDYQLVHDTSGFVTYCRLVDLDFEKDGVATSVIGIFPKEYWAYNWEGLAKYKNGYFVVNDKYTPSRPYSSLLLYLKPKG